MTGGQVRFKWVGRRDPGLRLIRLFRVLWGRAPYESGHRNMLSVAVGARLWHCKREFDGWRLTVAGLRLHYKRHPLGVMV